MQYSEDMSGEAFLDALDAAAEALDRAAMRALSNIAVAKRNIKWQAAARHADNYVVAVQRGEKVLQDICQREFIKLVQDIRNS